jgi:hypothetical protein
MASRRLEWARHDRGVEFLALWEHRCLARRERSRETEGVGNRSRFEPDDLSL